jgi:hypothetical protein
MSRTYRKTRVHSEYSLETWIEEKLEREKRYSYIFVSYGFRSVWLEKYYNKTEEESIKEAIEDWNKYTRDGKHHYHYNYCVSGDAKDGKLAGWKEYPKSYKKLPKRKIRRQLKRETQNLMKEYG